MTDMTDKSKFKRASKKIFLSFIEAVIFVVIMISMTYLISPLLERFDWSDNILEDVIKENIAYVSILISVITLVFVNLIYIFVPRKELNKYYCICNNMLKSLSIMLRGYILGVISFIVAGHFNTDIKVVITYSLWVIFFGTLVINPYFQYIEKKWGNLDKFFLSLVSMLYMLGIIKFLVLPEYS